MKKLLIFVLFTCLCISYDYDYLLFVAENAGTVCQIKSCTREY